MPFIAADRDRIRYYLDYSPSELDYLQAYLDAVTDAATVLDVQQDLAELDKLEAAMSGSATKAQVKKVGDIEFFESIGGGNLSRRRAILLNRIRFALGLPSKSYYGAAALLRS